MRVAALDLGSNTTLLLIADVNEGVLQNVVVDRTTITKLGQGVHANRRFHPEALARMKLCLGDYQKQIALAKCDKVIAVATSAARDVSNGDELLKLGRDLNIPIHIISGEREAELTFRGALFDRKQTEGLAVVDVGGGSTEIISHRKDQAIQGCSVDVGSVRLTELFVKQDPISPQSLNDIRVYTSQAYDRAGIQKHGIEAVVAVAGTPTTLAAIDQAIDFEETMIQGYSLSLLAIDKWIERLSLMPLADRQRLKGMEPGRADVIVAGSIVLATALRHLGVPQVQVSTRGVRYGVALSWRDF